MVAYERHEDYAETARQLGILQATAYAIIRRYQHHSVVSRRRGVTRNRFVDPEMVDVIVFAVEEHPEYTVHTDSNQRRTPQQTTTHLAFVTIQLPMH